MFHLYTVLAPVEYHWKAARFRNSAPASVSPTQMFRYCAYVFNPDDPAQACFGSSLRAALVAQSREWRCAFQGPDLLVMCHRDSTGALGDAILSDESGVAVGVLFKKGSNRTDYFSVGTFDSTESRKLVDSGGRHLMDDYWGQYVVFLRDAGRGIVRAINDPSGQLPCYWLKYLGATIFVSYLEDYLTVAPAEFSVDWDFIAAFACNLNFRAAQTGLKGVSELQPGEVLNIRRGGAATRSYYWRPDEVCRDTCETDMSALENQVRAQTMACVNAWCSIHPRIIMRLSGGLDSSVVLHCLKHAPTRPEVLCINHFAVAEGDERKFAQMVADREDCVLEHHLEDSSSLRLDRHPRLARTPCPSIFLYQLRHREYERGLAERYRITAIFDGSGGDHCFYQSPVSLAATDYFHDRGLTPDFLRLLFDISSATRRSIWSLLSELIRSPMNPAFLWTHGAPPTVFRCLSRDVLRSVQTNRGLVHPWLDSNELPPGKKNHILGILAISSSEAFYSPFIQDRDFIPSVSPLVSQPLMELCLRIPVYRHCAKGWDRALERRAFKDLLPTPIVLRRQKGTMPTALDRQLVCNRSYLMEFLLEGELVKQGIVSRTALETDLLASVGREARAEIAHHYYCIEKWLEAWRYSGSGIARAA